MRISGYFGRNLFFFSIPNERVYCKRKEDIFDNKLSEVRRLYLSECLSFCVLSEGDNDFLSHMKCGGLMRVLKEFCAHFHVYSK